MSNSNRLPGMDDAEIEELESIAHEYKKIQKRRMTALNKEVELKDQLLEVMKKNKRKHYKFEDLEIEIVPTGEKLKVKIAKEDGDDGGGE